MAEIVWAPNALDDVEKLIAYIGGDSIVRAQRFAARLMNRVESLGTQPESGSWLPEDERHVYRQIFHGAWRVIYRYDSDTVWIVAVHHSARMLDLDSF